MTCCVGPRRRVPMVEMSAEAKAIALLSGAERPDTLTSLKLGLDPTLPVITRTYHVNDIIGRGAFGKVMLGTHIESDRKYAIKMLETSTLRPGSLKAEVRILKECRHPNIVSLRDVFATEEYVYLVMEYARGGSLIDVIVKHGQLSESLAAAATMQVASALAFMHGKGVVHRDIKPENLLLDGEPDSLGGSDFLIKICDFGVSKICEIDPAAVATAEGVPPDASTSSAIAITADDRELVMKTRVGTHWYASPELLTEAATYDQSIDIWGLGLVLYILVSGKHPFEGSDMFGNITRAVLRFEEPAWAAISASALDLVRALLRADPKRRISASAVLRHEWMTEGMKVRTLGLDPLITSGMDFLACCDVSAPDRDPLHTE